MDTASKCGQCGAVLATTDDPRPAGQLSSGACFAAYGRVLARCYEDPHLLQARQLAVDAWAVQHPAPSSRISDQSLALHLMTLHLFLEEGVDPAQGPALHNSMMSGRHQYTWLQPPLDRGALSVADLSPLDQQHLQAWARAAWQAWDTHHSTVLSWVNRWRQPHRPSRTAVRWPGVL
jgi:Family of unknown function (DUF5946)